MSWKTERRVWCCELPTDADRLLLLAMAYHAPNEHGDSIYPSVATLMWFTGWSRRTVQRRLKSLADRGLIAETRKARRHQPTEYRICFELIPTKVGVSLCDAPTRGSGVPDSKLGASILPSRGVAAVTPKQKELKIEQSDEENFELNKSKGIEVWASRDTEGRRQLRDETIGKMNDFERALCAGSNSASISYLYFKIGETYGQDEEAET